MARDPDYGDEDGSAYLPPGRYDAVMVNSGTIKVVNEIKSYKYQKEENEMSNIRNRKQILVDELVRIEQQVDVIEKLGEEDEWADDTVLSFHKKFPSSGQEYTYVAYKVNGLWYLSGTHGAKLSWRQMINFIVMDNNVDLEELQVFVATGWEQVV